MNWLQALGARTLAVMQGWGHATLFFIGLMGVLPQSLRRFNLVIVQIYAIGNRSLVIILASGLAVGFVLALQMYYALVTYGAAESLGLIVNLSLVRELGPVHSAPNSNRKNTTAASTRLSASMPKRWKLTPAAFANRDECIRRSASLDLYSSRLDLTDFVTAIGKVERDIATRCRQSQRPQKRTTKLTFLSGRGCLELRVYDGVDRGAVRLRHYESRCAQRRQIDRQPKNQCSNGRLRRYFHPRLAGRASLPS